VLNIAVLVKQIPLIEDANFDPATKTIKRDGPNVISAFDLRAVSLAMDLKSRHGAETTVITLGPPQTRVSPLDLTPAAADRVKIHSAYDRLGSGSERPRQIFAASRFAISWCRGTASTAPVAGLHHKE